MFSTETPSKQSKRLAIPTWNGGNMISMKKTVLATACATAFMASSAIASETYMCKHGNQERIISVVYDVEGQAVPCKVVYTKDSGVETPWSAENLVGYCEEQAAAFVEKQRAWGWTCEKQEAMQKMKDDNMMKDDGMVKDTM